MQPDSKLTLHCKAFGALTLEEWYAISQAREQIFIVEQQCAYLDSDGQDGQAWHVQGLVNGSLACYARLLPPATHLTTGEFANSKIPAIGRVLTVASHRGKGIAYQLMEFAISQTLKTFGNLPIYISAQVYLLDFYTALGFVKQGESYMEDGIPHQAMVSQASLDI